MARVVAAARRLYWARQGNSQGEAARARECSAAPVSHTALGPATASQLWLVLHTASAQQASVNINKLCKYLLMFPAHPPDIDWWLTQ